MANRSTLRKAKSKAPAPDSAPRQRRLRAENKKLLQWLDSWLATPDDRDEAWWKQFEEDLQEHRVTLHASRMG